ncbi:MAG: hypothetical protein AB1Z65_16210, partial [Candidatus Sulfomarinibacteraceae bacterium]
AYNLSVNDLLYLKQNGAQETIIATLMATSTGAPSGAPGAPATALGTPPSELIFNDLVLVKKGVWGWLKKDHPGHLEIDGDTLGWEDNRGSDGSFTFETTGIDKVWFTCEASTSGNFCHQINFKIVKGDTYRFQDSRRDSGSNDAVLEVMEALRRYFPRLNFGTPTVGD